MRTTVSSRRGRLGLGVMCAALVLASPASAATVVNGDFETGTLSGFTVANQGSGGNWYAYSRATPPPESCSGFGVTPPPQGRFAATTSQTRPGSHVLYQDIALERKARHKLSFLLYYKNGAGDARPGFATPATLDYRVEPNQQYRVDIVKPSANPFSVASDDVLARVFRTDPGEPERLEPKRLTFDLSPYGGKTVRLRFAEVDNEGCFLASVDDIQVDTDDCTIHGTPGNDTIRGTARADVICAEGGNDIVYGLGGNDTLRGERGNDILRGDEGNDRLGGRTGNDQLLGGPGDDRLNGGSGRDGLSGQVGRDFLDSRDGVRRNDTLNGGGGTDTCLRDAGDVATSC